METNRLKQFCVVAEMQNLRKAAEILGISHSALSKSMKVLQLQVAQTLLTQVGRNIAISDAGRDFYVKAKELIRFEGELFKKTATITPLVRLGTFEVFSTHCIGSVWTKYFPESELELHELLPGKLEQALIDRRIDFGVTFEPIPLSGVDFLKLGRTQMGIYKRIGSFSSVPPEDLPFVAPIHPIEGIPTGAKGLDGWPDNEIPRRVPYRVDMMESALAFARQGKAAVFIPHFVAALHNESVKPQYRLIPSPMAARMKPVHRTIYLAKRMNVAEGSNERQLAKLVRSVCFSN